MVGYKFLLLALGVLCCQAQQKKIDEKIQECGTTNLNGHVIDDSESLSPGPFHDLTEKELRKLRAFLESDPKIKASKSSNATLKSSYIFTADLHLPNKDKVLNHLDNRGPQPAREALVVMFRGDLEPPRVEEYVCGPLPDVQKCELVNKTSKRNPVEFEVRPLSGLENDAIRQVLLVNIDKKVEKVLLESYGAKFTGCSKKEDCLTSSSAPVGTAVVQDIRKRLMWVTAMYNLPYPTLHTLDFSVLVDMNDTNPEKWSVVKVWYSQQLFSSLEELNEKYQNNSIQKTKVTKPVNDDNLFSSLKRRGEPQPVRPQRPPRLVEPDGKRYSVKNKKVEYMGWSFNYRLSPLTGPAILDLKYKGERIAYEISLAEAAALYSGNAPFGQTLNEIESSRMLGSRSRAVVPGAGCPETGTSLSSKFMNQYEEEPAVYNASWCIFENNNGHPLRRHLSYETAEGGFYGGMLDSALTMRSALAIQQNDYIVDFVFHQNGVCELKVMAAGYLLTSFYTDSEKPYGHRIHEKITGNHHHHFFHFKIDMDIGGTSNRYETLDISEEKVMLTAFLDKPYDQTKINTNLKTTEKTSITDFKFEAPQYHIVHNNDKRNKYNESKAYRIDMQGMSRSKIAETWSKERGLSWAQQQMVVTKRKDDEQTSSSIYAMLDSQKPAVNFSSFYEDDESIVDQDLIFWVTSGFHHIPRSEDIPNTAAVGNHLSIFLTPHNYHSECPSIASRDAIYIDYKDPKDPSKGVKVDRNGNSRDQCIVPKSSLEEDLEAEPDRILESRRRNPTDF